MTDFTRRITGFRFVQTQHDDTLQKIALRELDDASKWSQLVWLNSLVPPYLTNDPGQARDGVLLAGATLRVPAASSEVDANVFPDEVFLVDCQLENGALQFVDGDIAVVSGRANLRQALSHCIVTNHRELLHHPLYGSNLGSLMGSLAGPVRELVAADYIEDAMLADPRVREVPNVTITTHGDSLNVSAEVVPISGININVSKVV